MRRLLALILGGCAVTLSVALATFAATCGARAIPGNPQSACASAFSTFHVVYTALALAGALGAWFGARWVPAVLGGGLMLWGIMSAASTGMYAMPVGLVLILCAIAMPPSKPAPGPVAPPAGANGATNGAANGATNGATNGAGNGAPHVPVAPVLTHRIGP